MTGNCGLQDLVLSPVLLPKGRRQINPRYLGDPLPKSVHCSPILLQGRLGDFPLVFTRSHSRKSIRIAERIL